MKTTFDSKKTVFLIDGSSFLYRAYYGMRPMHTTKGTPVQAVYNFCRMIKKMMDEWQPQYIAIAWDSRGATFRHEMFPAYKATRQEAPSDLSEQKRYIMEFADLIGLRQFSLQGVEADDIMYSLALDAAKQKFNAVLVTSDKDMGQVIDTQVVMFDYFKDEVIDSVRFEEKYGFPSRNIAFYYALLGDASDNIPGVQGIGKVGATELVKQFASLQDVYDNIDKVKKERTRNALLNHKEEAFLSEKLFTLKYFKMGVEPKELAFDSAKWPEARPLFIELEFNSLLKDLEKYGVTAPEKQTVSAISAYSFIAITDEKELEKVCQQIRKKGHCAIDTEADLGKKGFELVGISLCVEPGTAYYLPVHHKTQDQQLSVDVVMKHLKPVLEDPSIKKYLQHTKFDQWVLGDFGIDLNNVTFDTMIAAHLVTKDWQRIGLKYLSQFYLNEAMLSYDDVVTNKGYKKFSQVPISEATAYAAADAHQTLRLVPILEKELREHEMQELFYEIEMPLSQLLFKMERQGMHVDAQILQQLDREVIKDLKIVEGKLEAAIGERFKTLNLNSPKQLEQLLFHELKLPPQKKTKTGFSTDQEVLEELAKIHPVPAMITRYRELFKLKSTYVDALPTYINEEDKKIHTRFSQTSVATGRLSSSDPNLQNIPVHVGDYPVQVRSAFKAEKGNVFISADYSQIELRVLAYLSQDAGLKESFTKGEDIHTITAAKLFDVDSKKVTNDQRQLGKRINFSILYGLTPYGLSKDLNIPFGQAKQYIEKYFAQYPGVSAWMEGVIDETKKVGYVTTEWGRRRYLPGIYEENKTLYDLARRLAINTKAQGTAAELMKWGMLKLDTVLKTQFPEAKILLQIHDELLISVPSELTTKISPLIKETLEKVVDWNVPLVVDIRSGTDWQEVTK